MCETYVFASGKGGVGKSSLSACLAVLLAQAGKNVVLIDADLGLRSQDLFLGVENSIVYDLVDAAEGVCTLDQALISVPSLPNLRLLPAAQFVRAKDLRPGRLKKMLRLLRQSHHFILIDCPAGLERGLRNVLNADSNLQTLLVVTPDDLSVRDGERVIALTEEKGLPRPKLLVNRLQNNLIYEHEMYSAQTVAELLDLPLLGEVPEDSIFTVAQLRHKLVIDYQCPARKALGRIAARMQGQEEPLPRIGSKKPSFFYRYFAPVPIEIRKRP